MILDEPFSGLDVETALTLRAVITGLAAEGRTILMSSHEIETVEQLCTDVIISPRGTSSSSLPCSTTCKTRRGRFEAVRL